MKKILILLGLVLLISGCNNIERKVNDYLAFNYPNSVYKITEIKKDTFPYSFAYTLILSKRVLTEMKYENSKFENNKHITDSLKQELDSLKLYIKKLEPLYIYPWLTYEIRGEINKDSIFKTNNVIGYNVRLELPKGKYTSIAIFEDSKTKELYHDNRIFFKEVESIYNDLRNFYSY